MAYLRHSALDLVNKRETKNFTPPSTKVSDYFGVNVYNNKAMQETLPPPVYKKVKAAIQNGETIEPDIADAVAAGMKTWAISKGATHYTHWFQPLTGATAEKHDGFFDVDPVNGLVMESFKGGTLVQQEPDASSFPNGGIRDTFEARGYTAWDPSSPAFIMEISSGITLCIPTIFISYTGEMLDNKGPLLKSLEAVDKAAVAVLNEYFDKDITKVTPTLGAEQEYFLVDEALFYARPDLVMCGRSVIGHAPARGQQLEDHYFGSIPTRVNNFMIDFETECQKLGMPIRTRHNEVAPGQFECAPTFGEVNVSNDQNQLMMDVMSKVAEKHHLKVLFHEKPFAGINGSGKHNNWSLGTDTGKNLLSPTSKPKENLQFLTFLVCVVKAVHDNADLLRASIASAGNDFRLGANEAPPAIMSIYLGSELTDVLNELEKNSNVKITKGDNVYLKLGISKIPAIIKDNTDRNRTSPFAFTGNKFEFRAVGSSANCAIPMMTLNLAVADALNKFKDDVEAQIKKNVKKEVAIINILRQYTIESKKICFEGNGYSEEWVAEAKKRGLNNVKTTPYALDFYVTKKSQELFERNSIMTSRELHAYHHIMLENYVKHVQIESRVLGDLALNHIIPTAIKYQSRLIDNARGLKELSLDSSAVVDTIKSISSYINTIKLNVDAMIEKRKELNNIDDVSVRAKRYCDEVKEAYFDKIRYAADKLELIVDDEDWPLVKYRELLFIK